MFLGLANSLFRLFRENSDVVPVSRLQKEGVRSVTVLDWERVEKLISDAVAEALARHGVELGAEAMRSVNDEAREAFARLLEQRDTLRETARSLAEEKSQLEDNLSLLRHELDSSTGMLAQERRQVVSPQSVAVAPDAMAHYSERLEQELTRLLRDDDPGGETGLARSVSDLARRLLEEERDKAFDQARTEQGQRIEQLERRIAKLKRMLAETESVVERLSSGDADDEGAESIYKEVQGLGRGDPLAEEKRGILNEIFRLNVELQDVILEGQQSNRAADRPSIGRERAAE